MYPRFAVEAVDSGGEFDCEPLRDQRELTPEGVGDLDATPGVDLSSPVLRLARIQNLRDSRLGPDVLHLLQRSRHHTLHFPLLADFEPKGEVARAYHVYRVREGTSERALYVIDAEGVIRWSYVSPVGVNPGADGILRALENLGEEGVS